MTTTLLIWLVAIFFLANPSIEAAQQIGKIPRIGFLTGQNTPTSTSSDSNVEAFRQSLRQFGYIEGNNLMSSTEALVESSSLCQRLSAS